MITIETQIGIAHSADFQESTWTFLMPENYRVVSGQFAIVDRKVYDEMMIALKVMRNYFGEHDMTAAEHKNFSIVDKAIRLNEPFK